MVYYDIHTHRAERSPDVISVTSADLRDESVQNALSIITDAYYSVGVHPWNVDLEGMELVQEYSLKPNVVAIGETGLDKTTAKTSSEFSLQRELFWKHVQLSEKIKKPLIIHCVKAWSDLLHIRKMVKPSIPWIVHGFRGKPSIASQLLDAGLYLSFGAYYHPEALKLAWEQKRLLAETDDQSVDIKEIYQQIASDLFISIESLAQAIEHIFLTTLKTE